MDEEEIKNSEETKEQDAIFSERVKLINKKFDIGLSIEERQKLEFLNIQVREIFKPENDKILDNIKEIQKTIDDSKESLIKLKKKYDLK